MDKETFDLLKESLKKIIANSIWFLSILLIAIFAIIQGLENINFGQLLLNTKIAGWYFALICFVLSLAIIKNYNSIINLFCQIESNENKAIAKVYLNSYPSILNPLSEQNANFISRFLNNFGYSVISISPFISLIIGLCFIKLNSVLSIIIVLLLLISIVFLRVEQRKVENKAIDLICPNSIKSKRNIYYIGCAIGLFISIYFQVQIL